MGVELVSSENLSSIDGTWIKNECENLEGKTYVVPKEKILALSELYFVTFQEDEGMAHGITGVGK